MEMKRRNLVFQNLTVKKYKLQKEDNWTGGKTYQRIPYADRSDAEYLDLYVPDGKKLPELCVIIHGGGFVVGDTKMRQAHLMYRALRDRGYACASVSYRLAQEAPFPAAIEDCKAAIRFLKANADVYGYNAEHITAFGESAGGYLALMCAITRDNEFSSVPFLGETEENNPSADVDVLIDYYGFTDIEGLEQDLKKIRLPKLIYLLANHWMFGKKAGYEDFASYWFRKNVSEMTAAEKHVADPYYYMEKNKDRVVRLFAWIVHGECDITIPYLSSVRLYERLAAYAGKDKVQLRLVKGMGHGSDTLYAEEILNEIDAFIKKK